MPQHVLLKSIHGVEGHVAPVHETLVGPFLEIGARWERVRGKYGSMIPKVAGVIWLGGCGLQGGGRCGLTGWVWSTRGW